MLQIRVHDDDRIAICIVEASQHGCFLAKIPRQADVARVLLAGSQLLQLGKRRIRAAIVDKQIREAAICHVLQDTCYLSMKLLYDLLLVVAGDNYRYLIHLAPYSAA